jgi:hypothetical protein
MGTQSLHITIGKTVVYFDNDEYIDFVEIDISNCNNYPFIIILDIFSCF